jgi:hypothetical protein
MSFLVTLEQKLGRFAIPKIISVLAGFQLLNWVLIHLEPEFMAKLMFDREAILNGQVWRLASFVLLPQSLGIWWALFIGFMFFLNNGLEEAWGPFRLNLFILLGIICIDVGGMLFDYHTSGVMLWSGVLIAFAVYFPNEEIMLAGIIPVKIKWLAWAAGVGAVFGMLGTGMRAEIFFSMLNVIITFTPRMIATAQHRSVVGARRQRYASTQLPESEALHRCIKCSRTEKTNPHLEFRVNADGDDICVECRAK